MTEINVGTQSQTLLFMDFGQANVIRTQMWTANIHIYPLVTAHAQTNRYALQIHLKYTYYSWLVARQLIQTQMWAVDMP